MEHPFLAYELSTGQVLDLPEFKLNLTERRTEGGELVSQPRLFAGVKVDSLFELP